LIGGFVPPIAYLVGILLQRQKTARIVSK